MANRRRRRRRHDATGRSTSEEKFYRLFTALMDSPAWNSLTCAQRCVYLAVARRYNGSNNGHIGLSVREAANLANCNKDTAANAFKVLEERGLIARETPGGFSMKVRHAAEWRLTAHPAGSDNQGTRDYLEWKPENKSRSETGGQVVRIKGTDRPDSGGDG